MKVEPQIDHSALKAHISGLYGFSVHELTFVPEGETSTAYAVLCPDGRRYFLKMWANSRQGLAMRARMDNILALTRELYERGWIPNLAFPIPTLSGELRGTFGGFALAIFSFADGQPLPADRNSWPAGAAGCLAQTLARLHQATDLVKSPLPQCSAFDMSFADELRRGLEALNAIGTQHRPGLVRLRNLLLPRRMQLIEALSEVEALCVLAQQQAGRLVLCHTDMGGNNVLVDESGKLFILDWDELILAPAEHDLQEYRGEGLAEFLALYYHAGGEPSLHTLQFSFYLKRRYLADIRDWLLRILEENTSPEQDDSDIDGIEKYCLASLENFEEEMTEITTALAKAAA